jgi:hypothetical protein
MRRSLVSALFAAVAVAASGVSAVADQPSRPPLPLGASAEAVWNHDGLEQYLSVGVSLARDGTTEVVAGMYTTRRVQCADGTSGVESAGWGGGDIRSSPRGVVVDKQLHSAVVSTTVDLLAYESWRCGHSYVPRDRLATHVGLDIVATSRVIHSLRFERITDGGKPALVRDMSTLRLAAGTVGIGHRARATTSAEIDHYGAGLGDGAVPQPTTVAAALTPAATSAPEVLERAGRYAAGEVRPADLPERAAAGTVLVDESGVNGNATAGEPSLVYAGRHRVTVVDCGGDLATVEQFWDGMGEGVVDIPRDLRSGTATATLDISTVRIDSCAGTDVTRLRHAVPVELHVTATAHQATQRIVRFDHEAGWTTTRETDISRWRDGVGWYRIGAWRTSFDVGGTQAYARRYTTHIVRW